MPSKSPHRVTFRSAAILLSVVVPLVAAVLLPVAATSSTAATCGVSADLVPTCDVLWGAHTYESVPTLQSIMGRDLAVFHDFVTWNEIFPTRSEAAVAANGTALFIDWTVNFRSSGSIASYSSIASGAHDSQIKAEAAALKAFGHHIMVTLEAEPDQTSRQSYGSPAEYAAAFRHIHDVFASLGVTNVVWVWDMTGDVADHGSEYPAFYPGDAYVNWIMWDPYNWYDCRPGNAVPWRTFSDMVSTMYDWLAQNSGAPGNGDYDSKPWGLGEYATVEGATATSKEDWFESIPAAMAGFPRLKALLYFDSVDVSGGRTCRWTVASSADSEAGFAAAGHKALFSIMP